MTISFPRALPAELLARLSTCLFELEFMQEIAPTRGGAQIARDLGPPLWRAKYQSASLPAAYFKAVEAWLESLGGSVNPFYGYDLQRAYAVAYPSGYGSLTRPGGGGFDGTALLASVAGDNVSVTIGTSGDHTTALPVGFVLTVGDYLAFDYNSGTQRALHKVINGGTADSNGVLTAEVRPPVKAGYSGATVQLATPSGKFKLSPGSVRKVMQPNGMFGSVYFEGVQTLF